MRLEAIAFDTGGTVLDWHSGIKDAFAAIGTTHGVQRDWATITNQYRRLAMKGIVGQEQSLVLPLVDGAEQQAGEHQGR